MNQLSAAPDSVHVRHSSLHLPSRTLAGLAIAVLGENAVVRVTQTLEAIESLEPGP